MIEVVPDCLPLSAISVESNKCEETLVQCRTTFPCGTKEMINPV